MVNYRQIYAIKQKNKLRILKTNGLIMESPGIYMFFRKKDDKIACYIGQAKNCLDRLASHLEGYKTKYPSHIDKSLQAHKLINERQDGWDIKILTYCKTDELNIWERYFIEKYKNNRFVELYNITAGGQDSGKFDIAKRNTAKTKSYKNGKNQGREKLLDEIRTYFDKYLDFTIKGKTNKTKERKLKEFKELLFKGEK